MPHAEQQEIADNNTYTLLHQTHDHVYTQTKSHGQKNTTSHAQERQNIKKNKTTT